MSFGNWLWNGVKGVGNWIGDNLLGLGDIANNSVSIALQNQIAQQNFESSEHWNQLNYDNMISQQEYDKWRQQVTWDREDNAVQRRALDLEKAGLSKTLAAGSAANAGSIVSMNAPARQFTGREASHYKQIAQMELYNNLRLHRAEALSAETQANALLHNLDIAKKAGVMTTDNSNIAQLAKALAGVFDFDVNTAGEKVGEGIKEVGSAIFEVAKSLGEIFTGNFSSNSYHSASPVVQATKDVVDLVNGTQSNEVTLRDQREGSKLPVGTKKHRYTGSWGSYRGSGGSDGYKAIYVK